MNAAEVLVKCLENEHVEYIFGIPGEENLDVMKALKDSSIRFIIVRHEQGAAFMADVYGRLTGKAGVCLSTLGPGATNLMTGVADANSDGAPLIALTGQVGTERMHLTSHQFLDLVEMFGPVTKRSKQIVRPDTVNEIVRIAFKYAESEKPGASHIDLPCNIAKMEITDKQSCKPIRQPTEQKEFADLGSIEDAAAMIFNSKRPIILAGHSAIRNHASKAINLFSGTLKIPVVNTMMAKGVVSYDNPYSMWTVGLPQKDYQDFALEKADLVIAVGYDLVEFSPLKWNSKSNHKIIHIDTRGSHINKLYQPDIEVVGDISDSLERIGKRISKPKGYKGYDKLKAFMEKEYQSYQDDMSYPLKPQKILWDIRQILDKEDIVISDVGAHKMWISRHFRCYQPNTCIISNGFASMGISIPGAIAAKLVYPNRHIIAVTGDGGFMMNVQELETAVRLHLSFIVLIFHDDSYGLIKWKEEDRFQESFFVDFDNPDFVKLAQSMHCKGYRIQKTEELQDVLKKSLKEEVPVIIDCPVDYLENRKLSEHLDEIYTKLSSFPLEQ